MAVSIPEWPYIPHMDEPGIVRDDGDPLLISRVQDSFVRFLRIGGSRTRTKTRRHGLDNREKDGSQYLALALLHPSSIAANAKKMSP
mmetsp:Transcript_25331/g.55523  ORF Transcript_25331/g.55523 Transcript_25331/m.55523 type:complete len:87 (+) Transcript_25331:1617-1877(+)